MEALLEQERYVRLSKDEKEMTSLMTKIVSLCTSDNEIITYIKILSKRKAQIKNSLKHTIKTLYLEKSRNYTDQEMFISFSLSLLKEVVEGKLYLEEERLIITKALKDIYEIKGMDKEALNIIYNVPVETFSSVNEQSKIKYQLEILRLCIKNQDWTKSDIIAKRIRQGYFKESNDTECEIIYYSLMIGASLGTKRFYEASEYFKLLVLKENDRVNERIEFCSFFAVISKFSSKRDEQINFCLENKDNSNRMRKILKKFKSIEIIKRDLFNTIDDISPLVKLYKNYFIDAIDNHNFKIVSNFFTSIKLDDLKNIMQCNADECLDKICASVNSGEVKCKIDQGKGLVSFETKKEIEDNEKIGIVMDKLIKINHMIEKENLKIKK